MSNLAASAVSDFNAVSPNTMGLSSSSSAADLSASDAPASAPAPLVPSRWILSPRLDFLFVYGGGPLVLLAINLFALGSRAPVSFDPATERLLLIAILLGQHIFADAHNAATYLRIWGSEADRTRFAFYRTWLVFFCGALFLVGLFSPGLTSILVYLYLITVFWHYAAQSFGIALIYCYKRGYRFTPRERFTFKLFVITLTLNAVGGFLGAQPRLNSSWFGVPLPVWGPLPPVLMHLCETAFAVSSVAFATVLIKKLVRDKMLFPGPSAMLVGTIGLLGLTSGTTNGLLWMYLPAFFHGSQYLAVCLSYRLKELRAEGKLQASVGSAIGMAAAGRFLLTVIATGAFLYALIPTALEAAGFNYALVAGLVLAVVNAHHFITDAAIWRLRDPRSRELLLA